MWPFSSAIDVGGCGIRRCYLDLARRPATIVVPAAARAAVLASPALNRPLSGRGLRRLHVKKSLRVKPLAHNLLS